MIAKITKQMSNGRNLGDKKEVINIIAVIAKLNGCMRTIAECRCYMAKSSSASQVYCSLWVYGNNDTSGSGSAGGYGYHKASAALSAAIKDAGIELYGNQYEDIGKTLDSSAIACISGCGSSAMDAAMYAIAEATGADMGNYYIYKY